MSTTNKALDHVTDVVAVIALAVAAMHGVAEPMVVGAITTIALGKRYIANK